MSNKINTFEEFKESLKENPIKIDMNLVKAHKEIEDLKDQLQQYKSIVKKVDPDDLPEGEVLAISKDREFLFGHLCSGKSVCENKYFFWCESLDDAVYDITHYIEQKDLIKMISEV